jgi:hypothetical protein
MSYESKDFEKIKEKLEFNDIIENENFLDILKNYLNEKAI